MNCVSNHLGIKTVNDFCGRSGMAKGRRNFFNKSPFLKFRRTRNFWPKRPNSEDFGAETRLRGGGLTGEKFRRREHLCSGAPWICQKLSGVPWSSQELHVSLRSSQELSGAPSSSLELSGAPGSSMKLSESLWSSLELAGAFWSSQ